MRTYFYKADEFPEVVVNERHELKSLANSCHIHLPDDCSTIVQSKDENADDVVPFERRDRSNSRRGDD
jgi:hypothetical protein